MNRIFTILLGLMLASLSLSAQGIDRSFVFVDDEGTVLDDGATVVRNQVEEFEEGKEVIYSGLSVLRNNDATSPYLRMHYTIERIDNGTYQLCFPIMCNMQTTEGDYVTSSGSLMMNPNNIQSEWFPTADGRCVVKLSIEIMSFDEDEFEYVHLADGPRLTLEFVKDSQGGGIPGDVNGDGSVNISDVNKLIDIILSGVFDKAGDVNDDGSVNIGDVNAVISLILNPGA